MPDLSVMNLDGSDKRVLTGCLDRCVGSPAWSADSRAIYVHVEDRGTNKVERVGLDGSIRDVATGLTGAELDRPYAGGEFSVAKNGAVAVTSGDPSTRPTSALCRGGVAQADPPQRKSARRARRWRRCRSCRSPRRYDKRPIDAWMVTPPDFDRRSSIR